MAKQQGSGVVAAAKSVSDIQGRFQDVGGQFMAGYNKSLEAKKAREAKAKEGIAKANALMDGFKDDIDYMSFTPEEGKLVKDQVVTWRNSYANLASQAAKIEDKTSPEYQSLMDEMSGYKNRLVSLKNNINGRQQLKADFKTELNDYSTAGFNDEAIAKATVMAATPFSGVNDRGELMWSDEGLGEFSSTGFKMPASNKPAKQAAEKIFNEVERQSRSRGPLTGALKEGLRNSLNASIGNDENLLSFIADNQFEIFKFDDLDPEADIKELRETVLDRLMNGLESTRGSALAKPSGADGGGSQSAAMQEKAAMWKATTTAYQNHLPFTIENVAGEKIRFADPHKSPKGEWIYTKQVFDEKMGLFVDIPAKSTKAWTLPEIQAEFGYQL